MSRFTSYTIDFTDGDNPDRQRGSIDLSRFVINDFTHHMIGEIAGSRIMRRRQTRPHSSSSQAPPSLDMSPPNQLEQLANVSELFSNPNLSEGILSLMSTNRPSRTRIATFKCEGDLGECSICQVQMKRGNMICRLPCQDTVSHAFHSDCIKPWLESNDTCPNCRSKI